MSAFHNSATGERLALRFHWVCFGVGVLHVVLGGLIMAWHAKGVRDHRENLEKLKCR